MNTREALRSRHLLPLLYLLLLALALSVLAPGGGPAAAQGTADAQRWRAIADGSGRAALEDYLREFPQGGHRSEAIDRLLDLGPGGTAPGDADSAALAGSSDRAALEDYLRRNPDGAHRSAAIDRLLDLGTQVAALAPSALAPARPKQPPPRVSKWQHGQVVKDCADCPELVVLRPGSFRFGSLSTEAGRWDDEGPAATVSLSRPIAVGRFEVTRRQFADFLRDSGRKIGRCAPPSGLGAANAALKLSWEAPGFKQDDNHPVVCVNWDDAAAYAGWLGRRTGQRYRLPTEAEWEYAARGGTSGARFWQADYSGACTYANVADRSAAKVFEDWDAAPCEDGRVFTAPVGSYAANGFGLQDMLGNVWEWVGDCWADAHVAADPHRAIEDGDCSRRVIKGGSWISVERLVRIAARGADGKDVRTIGTGFRVVRELD